MCEQLGERFKVFVLPAKRIELALQFFRGSVGLRRHVRKLFLRLGEGGLRLA